MYKTRMKKVLDAQFQKDIIIVEGESNED